MGKRLAPFSWMTSRNCCADVIFFDGMGLMMPLVNVDFAPGPNTVAGVEPEIDGEPVHAPSTVPTVSAERPG